MLGFIKKPHKICRISLINSKERKAFSIKGQGVFLYEKRIIAIGLVMILIMGTSADL